MREVQRPRHHAGEPRQHGPHIAIEHRSVGEGIEHRGAGDLLGDAAFLATFVFLETDAFTFLGDFLRIALVLEALPAAFFLETLLFSIFYVEIV
jgi:hypothetical protein